MEAVKRLVEGIEYHVLECRDGDGNDLCCSLRWALVDERWIGICVRLDNESEAAKLVWLDREEVGAFRGNKQLVRQVPASVG